jgi:hypothetical protein
VLVVRAEDFTDTATFASWQDGFVITADGEEVEAGGVRTLSGDA